MREFPQWECRAAGESRGETAPPFADFTIDGSRGSDEREKVESHRTLRRFVRFLFSLVFGPSATWRPRSYFRSRFSYYWLRIRVNPDILRHSPLHLRIWNIKWVVKWIEYLIFCIQSDGRDINREESAIIFPILFASCETCLLHCVFLYADKKCV